MPSFDTPDLTRIKRLIASPDVVEAGLLDGPTLDKANTLLGELKPGENVMVLGQATRKGLMIATAIQSSDGRFVLSAHLETKGFKFKKEDLEAGLTFRYSF